MTPAHMARQPPNGLGWPALAIYRWRRAGIVGVGIKQFLDRLAEAIERQAETAREAYRVAPVSYGAGYEAGWRDCLREVQRLANGDEDAGI